MKKATITISFEQEKLSALRFYAGKRGANPQGELDEFFQKLYEKHVPAQTREYIESREAAERPAPSVSARSRPAPIPVQSGGMDRTEEN